MTGITNLIPVTIPRKNGFTDREESPYGYGLLHPDGPAMLGFCIVARDELKNGKFTEKQHLQATEVQNLLQFTPTILMESDSYLLFPLSPLIQIPQEMSDEFGDMCRHYLSQDPQKCRRPYRENVRVEEGFNVHLPKMF